MKNAKLDSKTIFLIGLFSAVAIFSRWLPHPPNMTAVGALALFAGAMFGRSRSYAGLALVLPVAALLISDFALGFHSSMLWVYLGFALVAFIGVFLRPQQSWLRSFSGSLVASSVFFFVSNLGVWFSSGLYPKTAAGLAECFAMAIPFFGNQLAGDLVFVTAFAVLYRVVARSGARQTAVVRAKI